jgi:hypothetical protein
MAQYSMQEAIKKMLKESNWTHRYYASKIKDEWELLMGKTVSKYTTDIKLQDKTLLIYTNASPLKNELSFHKKEIIVKVNEYLGEYVINDVLVY